ncbi:MAG: TVP38/TMEM64 family protein [Gammaproteobacteria bacterium]|nr:TVP38/TMEM64 family protein [Gammaproteobacteria bacterium]
MSTRHYTIVSIILLGLVLYYYLERHSYWDFLSSVEGLSDYVRSLDTAGPFVIIGLMALAIVMSPLPSAPIALASGAIYGHTWGSIYILIGSELGAIVAFSIARLLGYNVLQRWFGGKLKETWVGSQNMLMGTVFISRLLPFLSFDIISYMAGLTHLHFWRFALATLAGIAPASFLLGHFGSELSTTNLDKMLYALLGLGVFFLIPMLYQRVRRKKVNREEIP